MNDDVKASKSADRPVWHLSYVAATAFLLIITAASGIVLQRTGYALPDTVYWIEVGMGLILVCLMVYAIIRKQTTYSWWETMLWLMSMGGIWVLALSVLPVWAAVLVAAGLTVIPYLWPLTIWHDAALLIGSVGVGLLAALHFPYAVMLVSALGVALYEYMRQQDMGLATLFSEADRAGVVPGLLLPSRFGGWFKSVVAVWRPGEGQLIGVLPSMVISAMAFHVAGRSAIFLGAYTACILIAGVIWGLDKRHVLRAWVFPAAGAGAYILYGLAKAFLL